MMPNFAGVEKFFAPITFKASGAAEEVRYIRLRRAKMPAKLVKRPAFGFCPLAMVARCSR
jgi:hypothetical protein